MKTNKSDSQIMKKRKKENWFLFSIFIIFLVCLGSSVAKSDDETPTLPQTISLLLLQNRQRSINSNLYYSLNKINHKSCKAGDKTGVCMFVWECMEAGGEHSGMCMDGFMFGSCCTLDNDAKEDMDTGSSYITSTALIPSKYSSTPSSLLKNKYGHNSLNNLITSRPYRPGALRPIYSPPSSTPTTPKTVTPVRTPPISISKPGYPTKSPVSNYPLGQNDNPNSIYSINTKLTTKSPPITIKPPKAPTRPTRPPKPQKPTRPPLTPWWLYSNKNKKPHTKTSLSSTTKKPFFPNRSPSVTATKTSTTRRTTTTPPTTTTTTTTTTTPRTTTTKKTTKPPSTGPFTTNVHSDHICGMQRMSPQPEGRIVNGTNSRYGEFPWQTSVRRTSFFGFSSTHRCGGALLNSKWVATAGHCVDDLLTSQIRLRVGEYDFSSVLEPYPYVEKKAKKKVVHPNYNFFTYEYDLALVEMESEIQFQPHIQPICLPGNQDLLIGEIAKVTGWGRLSEHGTLPSILQQTSVPIMSNSKCQELFLKGGRKEHIPDIFLCAGYEKGGRDSCQGDSGGPLQVKGADGRWFLAGIISWGIGCAEPNLPGVCTRISKFVPFILEHVT